MWNKAGFDIPGLSKRDIENLVAAGRGTAFENLGKVQTYGLELASTLKLKETRSFLPNINFAYTLLETEIIEGSIKSNLGGGVKSIKGKELPYAPRHTFIIGFESKILEAFNLKIDKATAWLTSLTLTKLNIISL